MRCWCGYLSGARCRLFAYGCIPKPHHLWSRLNPDWFYLSDTVLPRLSRVCAVAQYAVLEANAKVNGRGPFLHPHPSETPQPISMSCQIYYYVPQGVDVQNLVGIDSAVTDLRMREKTRFVWIFFINISIYPSIRIFSAATGHSFGLILTLNGSNDVVSQPLVPFDGHINIAPY